MANILTPLLRELVTLDYSGKGEAFVEARFLSPLLGCLGYESHKDYEVIRHGDDGSSFKLNYPPVEMGAQRVKHYNPDYIPTIRRKMFWVVEAKSPKDVQYPFEARYLVQGLQYCIHPEIQAKYLVVTNGLHSAVYDAHGSVFLEQDVYEPILTFASSELIDRWEEIFNLLSVEKLRMRIEADIKAMYDKLCLSSLDNTYPRRLLNALGSSAAENARKIEKHVSELYLESMAQEGAAWLSEMNQLDAHGVFACMDRPLIRGGGQSEARFFVEKARAAGWSDREIYRKLTADFETLGIFGKLQGFRALCHLYRRAADEEVKALCRQFFDSHKDGELPLLNQVECASLRVTRKICVLDTYGPLREQLGEALKTAPELVRFVSPPTALSLLYPLELEQNRRVLSELKTLSEEALRAKLVELSAIEQKIEQGFQDARLKLADDEWQIGGLENYGVGVNAFKAILVGLSLEPREA